MAVGTVSQTWNGQAWQPRPVPGLGGSPGGSLAGVSCTAADACTAVGSNYRSGHQVPLAEGWNGNAWKIQAAPVPPGSAGGYLTAVSCTAADSCVAVGNYVKSSGPELTLAEAWNGKTWSIEQTPNPPGPNDSFLNGVSCTAADACIAVGDNGSYVPGNAGAHAFAAMSEAWNGKAWQVEPVPAPAHTTLSYLQAVSCGAANSCVAVGSGVKSPTKEDTLAAVWNGRAWQLQATPNPSGTGSNQLDGVSCRGPGHCEAVGWYDSPSGPATFAEGEGVPSLVSSRG
jgi:hypothetical protein